MDRFDVCEGYFLYYSQWHASGRTRRCRWTGRNISRQLERMGFRPAPNLTLNDLREEDRMCVAEVYNGLVAKWEPESDYMLMRNGIWNTYHWWGIYSDASWGFGVNGSPICTLIIRDNVGRLVYQFVNRPVTQVCDDDIVDNVLAEVEIQCGLR